jgi:hypothetical protein
MLDPNVKALLPKLISDAMDGLTGLSNAPDEMTLPSVLAVANFASQAIINVDPEQWKSSALSEFFCVLAESGSTKSATIDPILVGIKEFEKAREAEYDREMTEYAIAMQKYNSAIKEAAKTDNGDVPDKPQKPRGIRHKIEKPTANGLLNALESVPFVGLFNSDAAEFFNSHAFQAQDKANEMISMLSKVWSGEVVERQTGIEENNLRLHNRRFNMLVMLQHQLADFLKNKQFKDQGFQNRLLITQCALFKKPEADWSKQGKQKINAFYTQLDPFNDRVGALLNAVHDMQVSARTKFEKVGNVKMPIPVYAAPNELLLEKVGFNDEDGAKQLMQDFYNEMANAAFDPKYEEYKNFMSRAYEHACRLAATLAVFESFEPVKFRFDPNYKTHFIKRKHAECAIGLMRYFIQQRLDLEVEGSTRANPITDCAEDVKKFLKRLGGSCEKKDLSQKGPNSYRKLPTDLRKSVITVLEDNEEIEIVEIPGTTKARFEIRLLATV